MATRTKNGAHATATKRTQELLATGRVGSVPQLIFGDLWEYDPAPESADPKIKPRYDLFIGGKFVEPKSGKYFDSINPATEKVLSSVPIANAEDVDDAYKAAQKAFEGHWGRMRSSERGCFGVCRLTCWTALLSRSFVRCIKRAWRRSRPSRLMKI